MVVTFLPATRERGATQERIAWPSRCTVQAPHRAMPHPYLVPVMPSESRSTQSKGVEGSTSTLTDFPLRLNEVTPLPPLGSVEPFVLQKSGEDDSPDRKWISIGRTGDFCGISKQANSLMPNERATRFPARQRLHAVVRHLLRLRRTSELCCRISTILLARW